MTLEFTPAASNDLKNIRNYIAQDNPIKAIEFTDFIEQEIYKLRDFPYLGTIEDASGTELPNSRKYIIRNYIAHYTIFEKESIIYITRIINGAVQNYTLLPLI